MMANTSDSLSSDLYLSRAFKIGAPLIEPRVNHLQSNPDVPMPLEVRSLEFKRAVPVCQDSFRTEITYAPNVRSPLADVREVEVSLRDPFNFSFNIKVNLGYSLYHLNKEVSQRIEDSPICIHYNITGFHYSYAGQTASINAKLKEVITIPDYSRLDVIFSYS